jgi:nitroreductase
MDAFEAIAKRRSVRKYKPTPVPRELIEKVVDAGRRAPTAMNAQPWEFIAITDKQFRGTLAEICDYGKFFSEAPVCIATFCKDTKYYLEDGCAAIENMLIAAAALELGTCWVAGDKKHYAATVAEALGVPAGFRLVGLIALGYAADAGKPTEKRPLNKVLHIEKW